MESESSENTTKITSQQRRVGLLYDQRMCNHFNPDDDRHPETPNRIRAIWDKLQTTGITDRCVILKAVEAEDKHILAVHSKKHVNQIKTISRKSFNFRRNLAARLDSIYFNEGSTESAYLAAGSAIEVVKRVASKELSSAAAIIRPPGHHAEPDEAMGFCLFNNVAIAASYLLNENSEFDVKKILIVDWDVHHGNGTQKMFWNDSRVLFFSVHRHEYGSFYPADDAGFYNMIGEGAGAGYNINVPWENGRCGDADYFAVWDHILLPVAKEFNPDIIIVSAGFDAAVGDPLGGCRVTPFGFSLMLKKLMDLAEGRIVLVLEGGYNLDSIAKSMHACLEVLLEDKPLVGSSEAYPFESTWRVIQEVRKELSPFWPTLASDLPQELISQVAQPPHTLVSSSDSEDGEAPPQLKTIAALLEEVIKPLSNLKVYAVAEQVSIGCAGSSSPGEGHSNHGGNPSKKPRCEENVVDRELFEKNSALTVSPTKTSIIRDIGVASRRKEIARGAAAMMRLLAMVLVLNDEEQSSVKDLNEARARKEELECQVLKLETDFTDYKEKYVIQSTYVTELREKKEELARVVKSMEDLKLEYAEEKKTLKARIDSLEAAVAPAQDEPDEVKMLVTRAELVDKIKLLEQDVLDSVKYGFDNAIAQLRIVNPEVELNTKGTGMLRRVVDGVIVIPPDCQSDGDEGEGNGDHEGDGEHHDEHTGGDDQI
ncbi:histone deacetylase [Trifolium repens]|nr:histone deacetylase [Trifolium repens]